MAFDPTVYYNRVFQRGIHHLSQQHDHLLAGTYMRETGQGEMVLFNRMGTVRMQRKEGRAVDLPIVSPDASRRAVTPFTYQMRTLIDEIEKLEYLEDPTNDIGMEFFWAGQREKDKIQIDAMLGTAATGKTGSGTQSLGAGQQIGAGGTGFTFSKVRQAVRMFKSNKALRPGDTIHCAWTAKQEEEFINTTEVKSSDFNTTKVLAAGGVDEFYKVKFHLVEDFADDATGRMLPYDGSTRSCVLWVPRHVKYAYWRDVTGYVDWVAEKRSWQPSVELKCNAVRMEEVGVVQLDVAES